MTSNNLFVTLPKEETEIIRKNIVDAKELGKLSANMLLQQLKEQGCAARVFKVLRSQLVIDEDVHNQTYKVRGETFTTIGIGISLEFDEAEDLLHAVDPSWDFKKMRETEGLPKKPLSGEEIDQLLLLSLLGVKRYYGHTQALIDQLKDLAAVPFEAYQLIALQSTCFNVHGLIGKGMADALRKMPVHGDLPPILELMEESNKKLSDGLQNRRLKDSALFHGRDDHPKLDVHLHLRQYLKLRKEMRPLLIPKELVWKLPIGDE